MSLVDTTGEKSPESQTSKGQDHTITASAMNVGSCKIVFEQRDGLLTVTPLGPIDKTVLGRCATSHRLLSLMGKRKRVVFKVTFESFRTPEGFGIPGTSLEAEEVQS